MTPQEKHLAALMAEAQAKDALIDAELDLSVAKRNHVAASDAYTAAVQVTAEAWTALEPVSP